MNPLEKLLGKNEPEEDEPERIPIDDLSGKETQVALEYLELLDREATRKNIEWAAYQLQAEEVPLVSPTESLEERETLDKNWSRREQWSATLSSKSVKRRSRKS